ncbi:uncharacterized protein LOC130629666 isoform X1 [Hydractinia symbiolongicarpus]|uniref:uncharacterized protein LOC130629666 isoform X1 n=1 Tax=Hydractinia symbiolongicarpus TaxID=13093 RepID=UPI00254DDE6C|nr:uncharacterized protein LOC130629666 isoform X1 [Hydractinia symbiolongicarpus]
MVYISLFIFATYTVISVAALVAPSNFKNENQSQTSLTFSWQLPSRAAGININKYYIECSRRNDNEIICAEFSGNLRRGTVHGLAVYSSYSCKIQATSTGNWSASVIQKTLKGAPCLQPLGMENNLIPDGRLTPSVASSSDMQISSVRLNSPSKWCSRNAFIQIDLGIIITITGLAIQGDTPGVTNVNITYGIKSPSDLVELWEESEGQVIRNFAYPASKYTKRHWFEQDAFTVRHIRISPVVTNKVVCLKIELYGCAETCSSSIQSILYPKINGTTSLLPPNIYSSRSWCSSTQGFLRYQFGMKIMLTGMLVQTSEAKSIPNFKVRYGDSVKYLNFVKRGKSEKQFIANSANNSVITHWFDIPIICSIIDIIPQQGGGCMKIGFTGCLTSCMNKLGVESGKPGITLSASSSYLNGDKTLRTANLPDNARLNSLKYAWARATGDPNVWLQVCFNDTKYIFGVALQGLGYIWNDRIKTYKIKYGYKNDSVIYDYKINNIEHVFTGSNNRYKTQLATLPTMLKAKCVRLHEMDCNNKVNDDQGCGGRLEIMGCDGDKLPNVVMTRVNNSLQCAAYGTHPNIQWSVNNKIITNDGNYTIADKRNQNATTLYKSLLTFKKDINNFLMKFGNCNVNENGMFKCTKEYACAYQYMYQNTLVPVKTTVNLTWSFPALKTFSAALQKTTSITFSWIPNEKKYITKYKIQCCRLNCREMVVTYDIPKINTSATVNELTSYTSYECKVKIFTASGETWSESVIATTSKGGPCMQPLGMESNVIPDDRLKTSISTSNNVNVSFARLNSASEWCSENAFIQIDLGGIMTITGLAIQGDTPGVPNVNIKYGVKSPSDLVDLWQEEIVNYRNVKRNFAYPGNKYTKRHWFYQNAFTARHVRIYKESSTAVCIKVELYGCSETCSSSMNPDFNPKMNDTTTVLSPNLYSSNSWCSSAGEFLRYDFGMEVTFTGILVQTNATKPVHNFQVRFGSNLKSLSIVKSGASNKTFIAQRENNSIITHWFDIPLICSIIDIIPQSSGGCIKIGFTGCLTSCMNKLGLERRKPGITLSASGSFSNNNFPDKARLNSLRYAWARQVGDQTIWLQVCFNETKYIFGVALQGLGYAWNDRIETYKIKYGYKHDSVIYGYKINNVKHVFTGSSNRYKTQVAILPTMLKANCIRLHEMNCNNKVKKNGIVEDQGCGGRLEIMGCNEDKLPNVVIRRVNNSLQCAAFGTHPNIQWSVNNKIITNDGNYTIADKRNQNATTIYKSFLIFKNNIDQFLLRFGRCNKQANGNFKCTKEFVCAYHYIFQNSSVPVKTSFNLTWSYQDLAVKKFSVISQNATSISFSWIPIKNMHITKYEIQCCRQNCREIVFTDNIPNTATSATVYELAPFTTYKCKMRFLLLSPSTSGNWSTEISVKTSPAGPCMQALGFENGIINDLQFTSSKPDGGLKASNARLNSDKFWCASSGIIWLKIDLGRVMTVTGMALQGYSFAIHQVWFKYSVSSMNNTEIVKMDDTSSDTRRTYDYPRSKYTRRYWFKNKEITLRYIEFHFVGDNQACLKVELYGCAETCSSPVFPVQLNLPQSKPFSQICSKNLSYIRYHFGKRVTLTGLRLNNNNFSDFHIRYGQSPKNMTEMEKINQTKLSQPRSDDSTLMFWFKEEIICKVIDIVTSSTNVCGEIQFIGCDNGCMHKLGIEGNHGVTMSSSSVYNNGGVEAANGPKNSGLNNMIGDWTKYENKDHQPWIQVCFDSQKLINAVAIQGQGYYNDGRVLSYYISYGYQGNRTLYNYTLSNNVTMSSGATSRYGTVVRKFPVPISAKCVRLHPTSWNEHGCSMRWELLGCHKATHPKVEVLKSVAIVKNTSKSIKCFVEAQPGFQQEWNFPTEDLSAYHSMDINGSSNNVNGTYISNLQIHRNMTDWIIKNNISCDYSNISNTTCYINYTCAAYYPGDSTNKGQQIVTASYIGFNATVSPPNVNVISTNTTATITISFGQSTGDFPTTGNKLLFKGNTSNIGSASNHFLDKLEPYTDYVITVSSYNRLTESARKNVSFKTAEGVPSIPRNVTLMPKSKEEILVSWLQPEPVGGVISKYEIKYKEKYNLQAVLNVTSISENMSFTIKNLSNFQEYEVQVRAYTKENFFIGPWSDVVETKTLEGEPTEPRNISVQKKSPTTIYLNWKEPYQINGIIKVYNIKIIGRKTYYKNFVHDVSGHTNATFLTVKDLYPGTNYTIRIHATTGGGAGPLSKEQKFETEYDRPYSPSVSLFKDPMIKEVLSLSSVQPYTGPISSYEFAVSRSECILTKENFTLNPEEVAHNVNATIFKGIENSTIHDKTVHIPLIGNFIFCFRAVVTSKNGTRLRGNFSSKMIERRDLLKIEKNNTEKTDTSITIQVSKGPSNVKYYQIIVAAGSITSLDPTNLEPYSENNKKLYITAEFPAEKFSDYSKFKVGDGKIYNQQSFRVKRDSTYSFTSFVNVELTRGTEYSILQRAYYEGERFYSTPWLSSVKTNGKSPKGSPTGGDSSNTTTIAVVSVVVVCIIVIILAALFIIRIRRHNNVRGKREHQDLSILSDSERSTGMVEMGEVNLSADMDEKASDTILDRKPPTSVELDARYPPVNVVDFPIYWERLKKDSHDALTQEYKDLNSGQQYRWTIANKSELKPKNRYANIVAYDHSRVRLKKPLADGSDYINASHIHGYSTPNMYIASQGPNKASIVDFWQMVWEQDVPVIVMATNLVERSKRKCEQYWPTSGTQQYGDMQVTLTFTDSFTDVVVRSFSLKKAGSKEIRDVQQYHYMSWPDHGVPEFPSNIINLRHKIRKEYPIEQMTKPILVHCSAGVGRTGTFICIDSMLHLSKQTNKVDVFNFVNFLRTRRIHMVQTEDQYMFIYHALYEAFISGITEINASDIKIKYRNLLRPNQENTDKSGFQLQYQRLEILTAPLADEDSMSGKRDVNRAKNRHSFILPRDDYRVMLTHTSYYEEGAEYINAVYVDGYKQKDAFIATNHPLPETIGDFWAMIYQKKISAVVMLNNFYEDDEGYPQLWPACGETATYKNITVQMLSEESDYKVATFKFALTDDKEDSEEVECIIFQFLLWPNHEVPSDVAAMVNFLSTVEKHQYKYEENSLVVMCSDGASRTGTFIAISIFMEQLKLEQLVDVFQAIKKIRSVRPQFVGNDKQYKFCYDVLLAYMDSFSTYSNYTD